MSEHEKTTNVPSSAPTISRRTLIGGAAAAAGAGALGFSMTPVRAEIERLQAEGWEAKPLACCMCGARCGLIAMKKKGVPVSQSTVRIMPNPDHPQRGYCGRGAQTMWLWNHPMRIRKPLKRTASAGKGSSKKFPGIRRSMKSPPR